jgi:hypothetical protein
MSKINHASVISNTVIEKKVEDVHENQAFNNPEIKSIRTLLSKVRQS